MGSLDKTSSTTFNSSRFLYSIASHTRAVVSVLKSDLDHRINRKASFHAPNNRQVVSPKRISHSRSEQQLKALTKYEQEQYSLTSAASPNAGSRQIGARRRKNSGCCYLCEVDDSQHEKQVIPESRRIHSTPVPESRRIHDVPLPESRCIESHSASLPKSRPTLPAPRRIAPLSELEERFETSETEPELESRHSVSRSASLRKALAELDTNIIPSCSNTPISTPRRIRVKPLSLSFTPSGGSSPRPTPTREHNRRVSYAGQSFFLDNDDPCPSPRTRRFPSKTPPQPFLLSPTRSIASPNSPICNFPSTLQISTHPPIPPLRRSSLLFRHSPPPKSKPQSLLIRLPFPSLSCTLGPPSRSRALPPAHLSILSPVEKQHYRLLITLTNPSTTYRDPLFTTLLQVATTEPCIRNLCLLVGKVYTEQEELRRWLDPVARNIDCAKAVEVLVSWLRKGGEEMEGMVGWLAGRLVGGDGRGGFGRFGAVGGVGVIGEIEGVGVDDGDGIEGLATMEIGEGLRERGRCSVM